MAGDGRVVLVEDDEVIRDAVARGLELHGFDVQAVGSAEDAIVALARTPADVIVLDLGLPNMDGIELCQRLRDRDDETPVLILSARDDISDRICGLEAGADDYVVKPFDLTELTLRVRALLRRRIPHRDEATSARRTVGPLRLDADRRTVEATTPEGDRSLDLTRREFDLLEVFMENPSIVLTRAQLLEAVWGYDFDTDTNVVDVFVGYLRKKMDEIGLERQIATVRGVGFVLGSRT